MSDNATLVPDSLPREKRRSAWAAALACAVLVLAGLAAYSDSFNGPFIFDDTVFVDLPSAKHLWPIRPILAGPRPVVQLTLALNYTLGGDVRGYHVFNVAVHLLAGLTLFGIMRRTLTMPRLAGRFSEESATALAFCTALLWTLHPLQTEAVTYVIQRMESLMGLFYLLALYCLIRSASSSPHLSTTGTETNSDRENAKARKVKERCGFRSVLYTSFAFSRFRGLNSAVAVWSVAAVAACALGMGCKEVMISAPAMLLLYDRIFITGSFRETLRRRWPLYAGLLATGFLLAGSIRQAFVKSPLSAGFRFESVTPRQYAQSQPGVILHYLALVFRPTGLCLDYNWPVAKNPAAIMPGAIVIGVLLAATVVALVRRPMWGFAGAWLFLILAPTSSFLPIKDLAFEHRMYLPLAAIAAVVVVAIYLVGERLARRLDETEAERTLTAELLALVLTLSAAAILGALTWRRNADYQTGTAIWQDTVNQRRDNPRAWNNLADAWINAGDYTDVLRYCDEAIRLKLNFPEPYNNRGIWYAKQGEFEEAVDNYSLAIQMRENFPMAYNNRASACIHLGRYEEAIQDCLRAVELDPELAMAYYNLGEAYSKTDDAAGAVSAYSKAIELNWNYAEAYKSRAVAHYCVKEYDKAWADAEACEKLGGRLEPDFIRALSRDSGRSR